MAQVSKIVSKPVPQSGAVPHHTVLWQHIWAILSNPSWDSVLAAVITALITLWYVFLTRSLLMDSRKAAVGVRLLPDKNSFNAIFLEIVNFSSNTAKDIHISFEPDPLLITKKRLSDIFGNLPVLFPNEIIRAFLFDATRPERLAEMFPRNSLDVTVSLKDSRWRRRKNKTTLNVRQFLGLPVMDEFNEIARSLDRTTEALLLTTHFSEAAQEAMVVDRRSASQPLMNPVLWIRHQGRPVRQTVDKAFFFQGPLNFGRIGQTGSVHPSAHHNSRARKDKIYLFLLHPILQFQPNDKYYLVTKYAVYSIVLSGHKLSSSHPVHRLEFTVFNERHRVTL
ncbi:hypothetical protein [Alicyclobacillus fastidiosus]|uniref:Uncharacterized protein n=1 Tax=Alicyclobacillus fastidiosus TaxID=392011 RepID=A0ABV5AHG4_9BACL|nr:hypothetical protein [Alicyclobacillus fastidiosus]WEH09177.1 hypothetical protein PYS47_21295 [Alicyclobacillus fastidiosus]